MESIYQRTRISKTTIYRILKTFVHRGYLVQLQDGQYHSMSLPRKIVFGIAGQLTKVSFSEAMSKSLNDAAASSGVCLLMLDNRNDKAVALDNADKFLQNHVDLVIEFQVQQQIAAVIGDRLARAGIPLIAVDIQHPHAFYFGLDNYRVGFEAGLLLARHAHQAWSGEVGCVLGLDFEDSGPLMQSRITGAFEGIRSLMPTIPARSFVRIDGCGKQEKSYFTTLDFLRSHPENRHILIAAATGTSALGTVEAVREFKREQSIAIFSLDCIEETIKEMMTADSPLVGSVSHEVHSYGKQLIHLGLDVLAGHSVPPYNYMKHTIVERKSLWGQAKAKED